ncbi:hypothetical protein E2562_023299 [Oryza meyeriana var. granulata]|uniref:DUF4371 domain-containing protein n=1 Tax=Oryza meyeriana var. granulata TaxID=110450 RepID=A0A6G1DL84_9ORYZ|nr:hypothetical protein E2562_023299 [Oryza meyeriana var. granulata]
MEPSDCQSCNQDSDVSMEEVWKGRGTTTNPRPQGRKESQRKKRKDSGNDLSCKRVDIDRAINLMRFVFDEGLAFLDNGSGRSLEERMLVDMSCYMVNQMLGDPSGLQHNGPPQLQVLTPTLDTDIGHSFAKETRKAIAKDIQGDFFGIFVDLCSTNWKCYMTLFVRYVDGKGGVVERLLGIVPDPDVSGPCLKQALQSMLSEAGLSLSSVRGQGYGLASYSDKIFSEVKASLMSKNEPAYCVHPHVCQLHPTLVSAAYDQFKVYELFQTLDVLFNLVQDCPQFTEKVHALIQERGLYVDNDLQKPGETCWGSYYEAIVKFAAYFSPICDAVDFVHEEISRTHEKYLAYKILEGLTYDVVFGLLLMQDVLSVTNELSLALDRKDQDAENCMILLREAEEQLQVMRDSGWLCFLNKVGLFCNENDMHMPNMGEEYIPWPRLRDNYPTMTNLEHYHVDFFQKVVNKQLEELNKRFEKESTELVLFASCLNPRNSFQAFDKDKLIPFAWLYPSEFSDTTITVLDLQLQAFIADVRSNARFRGMNALGDLSVRMVETGKNNVYPLVYLLLKLALILPGTPATVKAASSAMKFINSTITKEPCNQWISDCLLLYLERDIFGRITNDAVIASL